MPHTTSMFSSKKITTSSSSSDKGTLHTLLVAPVRIIFDYKTHDARSVDNKEVNYNNNVHMGYKIDC